MSVVERIGGGGETDGGGLAVAAAASSRRLSPLGAAAITLYATLLCLGLAIPSSVVSGLRDAPPGPFTEAALRAATVIEAELDATGVPALYRAAKERFRRFSCGAPDSANPC